MEATLLVELLTEELPPKSLRELSEAFSRGLRSALERSGFVSQEAKVHAYATPRRLAARIEAARDRSPDTEREVQGPSTSAPAQAIAGFARKHGVAVDALRRMQTPKGEVHVALARTSGQALDAVLAGAVAEAVKALPISKMMRWGAGDAQFVRPVHGLVMLHGNKVVPGSVLGLLSSNETRGHRFLGKPLIAVANADEYETKLFDEGKVVADFGKRKAEIDRQLKAEAQKQKASLGDHETLLDEVTALVEYPSVYVGTFDAAFLSVPQECLILTMRQNQKYFPLFDPSGKLLPKFLIVSNMQVDDPRHIISGNERVVRPRLGDARFFYDQDRKRGSRNAYRCSRRLFITTSSAAS
jgi:glycyl-tRNA synthetase beta chain